MATETTPAPTTAPTTPPPTFAGAPPPAAPKAGETPAPTGAKPAAPAAAAPTEGSGEGTKTGEGADATPPPEFKVTLPEGVVADEKAMEGLKALAKESGWTSQQAQKVADLYVQTQKAQAEAQQQAHAQQVKEWGEAWKGHPTYGGAKLPESQADAQRGVELLGGEKLRAFLNETGLGNHPVLCEAFVLAGRLKREDSVAGSTTTGGTVSDEEAALRKRYPSMFPSE